MRIAAILLSLGLLAAAGCQTPTESRPASATPASSSDGLAQVSGRAPASALVTLELAEGSMPMPEGGAVMDQFSKAFVPETLFVRVGQPVTFKNSEDQLHNITVVRSRTGRSVVNISQSQGDVYDHTFEQVGEYDVSCDVHPGMRAIIVASATPFAAFADPVGAFTFAQVPAGKYRLKVSADGRESERIVEVAGGQVDIKP